MYFELNSRWGFFRNRGCSAASIPTWFEMQFAGTLTYIFKNFLGGLCYFQCLQSLCLPAVYLHCFPRGQDNTNKSSSKLLNLKCLPGKYNRPPHYAALLASLPNRRKEVLWKHLSCFLYWLNIIMLFQYRRWRFFLARRRHFGPSRRGGELIFPFVACHCFRFSFLVDYRQEQAKLQFIFLPGFGTRCFKITKRVLAELMSLCQLLRSTFLYSWEVGTSLRRHDE